MMMMTELMAASAQVSALRACQAALGVRGCTSTPLTSAGGWTVSTGQPDLGSNPAMPWDLGTCLLLSKPLFVSVTSHQDKVCLVSNSAHSTYVQCSGKSFFPTNSLTILNSALKASLCV